MLLLSTGQSDSGWSPRSQEAGAGGELELGSQLFRLVESPCPACTGPRAEAGVTGVECLLCAGPVLGPFAWIGRLLGQWGRSVPSGQTVLILSKLFQEENQICLWKEISQPPELPDKQA